MGRPQGPSLDSSPTRWTAALLLASFPASLTFRPPLFDPTAFELSPVVIVLLGGAASHAKLTLLSVFPKLSPWIVAISNSRALAAWIHRMPGKRHTRQFHPHQGADSIVTYRVSSSSPRRASVDLGQSRDLLKGSLVSERDVDDAVVYKSRHGGNNSALLPTAWSGSRDEDTRVLAPQSSRCPQTAGGIPEILPLRWEVSVTSWDTNQESIISRENFGGDNWDVWLSRGMHLGENLLWQGLWDSMEKLR